METISRGLESRAVNVVLILLALLLSLGMLASLSPLVKLPSLVQIIYYLLVPGFTLLRLADHQFRTLDALAMVVTISFGLLVGLTAFFQTFYAAGGINQSLLIPLIAICAGVLSLRTSLVKRP